MLFGHISDPETYTPLLNDLVWQGALGWIENFDADLCPEGEHKIRGHDMYAIVREVKTRPREQCRFESHQQYIDLQYCVVGFERIEWMPSLIPQPNTEYDKTNDVLFYPQPSNPLTTLLMTSGAFAIFFPGDVHMPEINYGPEGGGLLKIVIKIRTELV